MVLVMLGCHVVALCTTVLHTVCIFVCFVRNVLLWHVHVQTAIRQTDRQTNTLSVRVAGRIVEAFVHTLMQTSEHGSG